jgi:hypothetical protein
MAESDFQADQPRDRPPARRPPPRIRPDVDDEDDDLDDPERFRRDPVEGLIPYRNPRALTAYYCAVFGLIPCAGPILGPLALGLGIVGLRHSRRNPSAGGAGHAYVGIILGAIDTVLWVGVVGVILGIFLHSLRQ